MDKDHSASAVGSDGLILLGRKVDNSAINVVRRYEYKIEIVIKAARNTTKLKEVVFNGKTKNWINYIQPT